MQQTKGTQDSAKSKLGFGDKESKAPKRTHVQNRAQILY